MSYNLELKDAQSLCTLPDDGYTKTLGVEWNVATDHFCLKISELPHNDNVCYLVSDVAKTFDVLHHKDQNSLPATVGNECDDEVICEFWLKWRSELGLLSM